MAVDAMPASGGLHLHVFGSGKVGVPALVLRDAGHVAVIRIGGDVGGENVVRDGLLHSGGRRRLAGRLADSADVPQRDPVRAAGGRENGLDIDLVPIRGVSGDIHFGIHTGTVRGTAPLVFHSINGSELAVFGVGNRKAHGSVHAIAAVEDELGDGHTLIGGDLEGGVTSCSVAVQAVDLQDIGVGPVSLGAPPACGFLHFHIAGIHEVDIPILVDRNAFHVAFCVVRGYIC